MHDLGFADQVNLDTQGVSPPCFDSITQPCEFLSSLPKTAIIAELVVDLVDYKTRGPI